MTIRRDSGGDGVVESTCGDANVFQEAGFPAVSLSSDNMYYPDLVWERDSDRIELLDEDSLSLARRFAGRYALQGPRPVISAGSVIRDQRAVSRPLCR